MHNIARPLSYLPHLSGSVDTDTERTINVIKPDPHGSIAGKQVGYGNCSARTLFGVVLPTFTRMGSRSFPLPVYFTCPFMLTSRVL